VRFGRRDIFEDVATTLLATATVMGFTATHQYWDVADRRQPSLDGRTAHADRRRGVRLGGPAHWDDAARRAWLRSTLLCGVCLLDCLADGAVAARGDHHPRLGAGRSP
jgi:hypothetical protein